MSEHIVATFDTDNTADAATRDLENAGIQASAIRRYRSSRNVTEGVSGATTHETTASTGGGFWAWLLGDESTETTRSAYPRDEEWYDQRAQSGHAVLSVMVHEDAQIHQVVAILDSHHPIGIEESTEEGPAESELLGDLDVPVASQSPALGNVHATPAADRMGIGSADNSSAGHREEVIPLAEENIEVGKRTIDRGATRVRRYVVETPIEREVTLHGERVTIERRRPADATTPAHAFEERTVEVRETEEVPVIEKTARVVEEVAIRKEETERSETVRDTVRREEVEVTDQNSGRSTNR